jgi:N12 class adenine-specific DNA methylase
MVLNPDRADDSDEILARIETVKQKSYDNFVKDFHPVNDTLIKEFRTIIDL